MEHLINLLKNELGSPKCLLEIKHLIKDFHFNTPLKEKFEKPFERQLLFRNPIFEIYLLKWQKDYATDFHLHPKNGCILRVISGQLLEIIKNKNYEQELHYLRDSGDISYIDNEVGLHKIIAMEDSLSIHIYSPPNFFEKI